MAESVFFAVVQHNGVESPRRFFESVPRHYSEKCRAGELVYCTRIDNMPTGDSLVTAPLDQLMRFFLHMRKKGNLPPQDKGGKPKAPEGKTTRQLGDWWEIPKISWDAWAPFIGWPNT